jgi:N-formylglutamate deformylase
VQRSEAGVKMLSFNLQVKSTSPIVVSVPHCGIEIPDEIKAEYKANLIKAPDDTDWFVDILYDFVVTMGITLISAKYSRWVIDLNRDVDSKPLYTDGRIITALCPTTTFLGEALYNDERKDVDVQEVQRRLKEYYYPYHSKIQSLLDESKRKFGKVLLWDCHSIRQVVPTIQKEKFPDLILGDADERACDSSLIKTTLKNLGSAGYSLNHNHPFKGGTITRSFGKPSQNQHALQLEMTKVNYMDDSETKYDKLRADKMREVLKRTFSELAEELTK